MRCRFGDNLAHPAAPYAHLDLQLPGELLTAAVYGVPVNAAEIPPNRRQRFSSGLPARGAEIMRGSLQDLLAEY
jgi:hypothetical protein